MCQIWWRLFDAWSKLEKQQSEEVVLELSTLNYFAAMSNLLINIDGEIVKADRINFAHDSTLTGNYKESYQRFKIDKQTLTKILNAKKVWLKVSISGGNYLETNLIDEGKNISL